MAIRTCAKCGEDFNTRIKINGKSKKISFYRKYCLKCLPFGKYAFIKHEGSVFKCRVCNKECVYNRGRSNSNATTCGSCAYKARKNRIKKKAIEYKGGKCKICEYSKCDDALVFHHDSVSKKEITISSAYNRRWSIIQKELDKCTLLCANCHAEIHSTD